MLEITGTDIQNLSDSDLRSLIGLLSEAEVSAHGLSTASITYGGHQNAKDGGIDVRVNLANAIHGDSYIPRPQTGFQVKITDMSRKLILDEMRPDNEIRQSIKELADVHGAYIIASSGSSVTDSSLRERKQAMDEALHDVLNASSLVTDFYDCGRIAGWVRSHPSLILWIRDKIGRPIQGWKPFGNWSGSPGGVEAEYLLDGHVRLYNDTNPLIEGLPALDAINELRKIIRKPGSCLRLTGLSGVGKTRLLQTLFDERLGKEPLNKAMVFYSNISDNPNPDPRSFAESLIALRKPAILAVDNCPPELHRSLTSLCSSSGSLVSLVTIEYDVRDDLPEETEVFRLEPASLELIEKVIINRFEHVSQVDAHTIAEFSGGNARMAIALAQTVEKGENLGNLRDDQLFRRLFYQRNEENALLLKVAEVLSLVYSFEGELVENDQSELTFLGGLIHVNANEIFENVSELKRRNLIQSRGKWRAVLPHALANRLAQRALQNIPAETISKAFEKTSKRLIKSFSRRLSYLHENETAIAICNKWLSKDGLLCDVSNLNDLGINLFRNIVPIDPLCVLATIERASVEHGNNFLSRKNPHYYEFTRILRSLAYDKDLFDRSIALLCNFALSESVDENNNSTRSLLKSLFYIQLSGTHATAEQRLKVIQGLIESGVDDKVVLGFSLIEAALEAWHFTSHYGFEFGARSRDYGYSPKSPADVQSWFKLFIDYTVVISISNMKQAPKARKILAQKFRGMWSHADMGDELVIAASKISEKVHWNEGWVAVKETKLFDGANMSTDNLHQLDLIDVMLRPADLKEKIRLYAFSDSSYSLDFIYEDENKTDGSISGYDKVQKLTRLLGHEVAVQEEIINELLPEALVSNGGRLYVFGQGLAEGCGRPKKFWQNICEELNRIDVSERNHTILCGFLNGLSQKDQSLADELLDDAVSSKVLAHVYPILQTSVRITSNDVVRLKYSLKNETAPIRYYIGMANGRSHEAIHDEDFCELLRMILSKEGGLLIATEILYMRLNIDNKDRSLSGAIVSFGRELLTECDFSQMNDGLIQNKLGSIIENCLVGKDSELFAVTICEALNKTFESTYFGSKYKRVFEALAKVQPEVFLDSFLGENTRTSRRLFSRDFGVESNPISLIKEEIVISWCENNPKERYLSLASSIIPFRVLKDKTVEWTSLACKIVVNTKEPIAVLNEFLAAFMPMVWSGSRAVIMQSRLCLFSELKKHTNSQVVDWANREEKIYEDEIRNVQNLEAITDINRNATFE